MRLSFDLPSLPLTSGQSVRAEVVSSDEKGSDILLNGIPTRVSERLEAGKKLEGKIERNAAGQAVLDFSGEAAPPEEGATVAFLSSIGSPPDAESMALTQTLRKHGIPLTEDWFRRAREMMLRLGVGAGDKAGLDALVLMLRFRSGENGFPLLKEYVNGNLKFGALFEALGRADIELLRQGWGSGRLVDRLLELISQPRDQGASAPDLPASMADNLALQELLSQPPQPGEEGRVYFQWPLFWEGQDVPDTLEGEAFVPPKGQEEQGYSLRILVHPPTLGDLEVAIHRLESQLWIHFSAALPEARQRLGTIFPALQARLKELSWSAVKLTVGTLPARKTFLGPTEPASATERTAPAATGPRRPLDIRA
ncbi:MAG TPA: flagellar hook-length control protein FliK [Candidatus Ozemobacteraceae bacterium]|nr:flagellar hook-length control protein FliK [Candidatus Ozemobacteraceae bacterium]